MEPNKRPNVYEKFHTMFDHFSISNPTPVSTSPPMIHWRATSHMESTLWLTFLTYTTPIAQLNADASANTMPKIDIVLRKLSILITATPRNPIINPRIFNGDIDSPSNIHAKIPRRTG